MTLEVASGLSVDPDRIGDRLAACFAAVWYRDAENDGYNALVVNAGLGWRDIAFLRTISRFLHQAGSSYSQDYMWQSLNRHPDIAALLIDLLYARFDPERADAHPRPPTSSRGSRLSLDTVKASTRTVSFAASSA
jgi:glutamate dehydrogenase